jgi:large subunit ribosomal protein L37Ae
VKRRSLGARLRTRGGLSVRKRWTQMVIELKRPHKCPTCGWPSLSRLSVGIWSCANCGSKFAGGAYQPTTKTGLTSHRVAGSKPQQPQPA